MIDLGPSKLILAGYVPLTSRGFALPCFATGPRPNAWYTATCSVDADHTGQITGFEVFESGEILVLSPRLQISVQIGSPWTDVFLWNDKILVGTPREIWNALEAERSTMLSAVPLTGLDLALGIPDQNVTALIDSALEFMQTRFGTEKAQAWRSGTLARQQLLIGLRRLANEAGLGPEALAAIGNLRILPFGANQLSVQVPSDIVEQFSKLGRQGELDSRIKETIVRLGLTPIDAATEVLNAPVASRNERLPDPEPGVEDTQREWDQTIRILIVVTEGKRARDIARHITHPEWKPDWLARSRVIFEIETIDRSGTFASMRVFGERHLEQALSFGEFDVIVLLLDEQAVAREFMFEINSQLARRAGPDWKGIGLLAPALPEDTPSEVLSGGGWSGVDFGRFDFNILVDTSVARSPFWSGNPRRALDSRIADVVMGAALLSSGQTPLRRRAKRVRRGHETLLTFALARTTSNEIELGLASEVTWARSRNKKLLDLWSTAFVARDARPGFDSLTHGIAEFRDQGPRFEDFASAVLTADKTLQIQPEHLVHRAIPAALRKQLTYSKLAAGFQFQDARLKGVAISAEAPTLDALRAAGSEGWVIVRYTDKESIAEIANLKSKVQLPYLPRQLRLPNISRRPENRGLATRGIDPRDVVRLTSDDWNKWKVRLPSSLRAEVRKYRTSLLRSTRSGIGSSGTPEFVLPRRAVQQAIDGGSRWAHRLVQQVEVGDRSYQSAGKRLADLRVAWSKLPDGASRFILADGVIPVEMEELAHDEVPAQRFFIIDGDAGVPALLGSRIFSAWAKITLTRSTSWMPRFSIGRTFETFPVPPPFLITRAADGPSHLSIAAGNTRLSELAKRLHRMYRKRSLGSTGELHAEIDKVILRTLKIKEGASDLAIVELLLQPDYAHYV